MKPEQRLLLAITLTLGILMLWSALMPPPEPPKQIPQPTEKRKVIEIIEPVEPTREFSLASYKLGLGSVRGGIRDLQLGQNVLLRGIQPGFLQVELVEPAGQIPQFSLDRSESETGGGVVLGKAQFDSGLEMSQWLSFHPRRGQYLLECRLALANRSGRLLPYRARMVAYRPVNIFSQHDAQYKYGMAQMGGTIQKLQLGVGQTRSFEGSPSWITAQGKTHVLIFKPEKPEGMFHVEHPSAGGEIGWLELPPGQLVPGEERHWNFLVYAGPIDLQALKAAGLEDSITFGLFSGIAKLLLDILRWSEGWLHNLGHAILFVSVSIGILFFPVTWSSVRMMKNMAKIQPHVERIRKEHGKDPQRMNREMMELYKKYRVNPLSGCLPLLLQMPIFIALFQALNRYPALSGAGFLWMEDLSKPDALFQFGITLPVLGDSFNLLPILMTVGMFFQQKMSQPPQKPASPEQAIQQKMFKFFPLLFGFLFYGLPSGLMLYWATNTALTLGQYWLYARLDQSAA